MSTESNKPPLVDKLLRPFAPRSLHRKDIDEMMTRHWSQADIETIFQGSQERATTFFNLPLHLQTFEYFISTTGKNSWEAHPDHRFPIVVPGNSRVWLTEDSGRMDVGWGSSKLFDSNGYCNGQPWPELPNLNFLRTDMNRFCFMVKVGNLILWNSGIAPLGASTSAQWALAADKGGWLYVAFNDEDSGNNSGVLTQKISWMQLSTFATLNRGNLQARIPRVETSGMQ
jgi:hypothetical protein